MKLFFDTETAGLPKRWDVPLSDLDNWPRLVQLGWVLCDRERREVSVDCRLVRPVGFEIPPDAIERHGITNEYAFEHGEDLTGVLADFFQVMAKATLVVAHNVAFDEKVIGAEFLRAGMEHQMPTKQQRCTMTEATQFCGLKNRHGFKWPRLSELYQKLFATDFDNAHDALADSRACQRCFYELVDRKIIES